ncbi:hypothetical protein H072_8826 [Dactylellina haptotyla CBS 200.50]|uniref:Uncharacterized protein n=1 Tax=Dactylellina haptotyla (strain CBS 200.50) TaxID=1284197 RepID=S8A8R0_DACHA|nr:hypothetical protein H072_8826 [Dactylellina haptotyla CBS 200.50]
MRSGSDLVHCGSSTPKHEWTLQGMSPKQLFGRSPLPDLEQRSPQSYWTCEDYNGDPRRFSEPVRCCDGGGVCGAAQRCCQGGHCCNSGKDCCDDGCCKVGYFCCNKSCIPDGSSCCDYPITGTWCSKGYGCWYDLRYYTPYCCTTRDCYDWDTVNVLPGYNYDLEPPRPSTTEITYRYYTRTVIWYYYVYYWIYIVVYRTNSLSSERVTTTSIISAYASDTDQASRLLRSSASDISDYTPVQATTEFRGETPPPTTEETTPEPTLFEPSTPPPRTTSAAALPKTTIGAAGTTPRLPTAPSSSNNGNNTSLSAAGLNRLEPLSGVGGSITFVPVVLGLAIVLFTL